jgi:hypothetical protein
LELNKQQIVLFCGSNEHLPMWFTNYDWGLKVNDYSTSFLPKNVNLNIIEEKMFNLQISNFTRALMECLYLSLEKEQL